MVVGTGGRPAALGLWSPGWGGLCGCSMQAGELSALFLQWWTEALAPGSRPSTPLMTGVLTSRPAGDFLLPQSFLPRRSSSSSEGLPLSERLTQDNLPSEELKTN